jgi:hypothetical protein
VTAPNFEKEALAEQGFALKGSNGGCNVPDRAPAGLYLAGCYQISDLLGAICQPVAVLGDKVAACQSAGSDQRQHDICWDH